MGKVNDIIKILSRRNVYIDTNLFIYFLDKNEKYFHIAKEIMLAIGSREFNAYTGHIAVAEVLVKPYRLNNIPLITAFKSFFSKEYFIVQPHDFDIFDLAAQLRAKNGMKFPDALHYATALKAECNFFITNDTGIKSSDTLKVIIINDLLG